MISCQQSASGKTNVITKAKIKRLKLMLLFRDSTNSGVHKLAFKHAPL